MPSTTPFCPLCLVPLNSGQRLYVWRRYRTIRREVDNRFGQQVPCDEANIAAIIKEDRSIKSTPLNRIYLAHAGCQALNPFYDRRTSSIDFGADEGPGMANAATIPNYNISISHPQVGALKEVEKLLQSLERPVKVIAMWYPAALLGATAGTAGNLRSGSVVMMAGTQGVGKSILTVQASHKGGFINRENVAKMNVSPDYFVYSRIPEKFAEALKPMRAYTDPAKVSAEGGQKGTHLQIGELRAVFYPSVRARRALRPRRSMGQDFVRIWNPKTFSPEADPGAWRTILFYDVAGELFQSGATEIVPLFEVVDSVSIVVEAKRLLKCTAPPKTSENTSFYSSLAYASSALDSAFNNRNIRWSVVITKLDEIRDRVQPSQWAQIHAAAEGTIERSASGTPVGDSVEPKQLLFDLVGNTGADPRQLFKASIDTADPQPEVFFIWTIDLPPPSTVPGILLADPPMQMEGGNKKEQDEDRGPFGGYVPYSYGLGKLIAYYLGENDLSSINRYDHEERHA